MYIYLPKLTFIQQDSPISKSINIVSNSISMAHIGSISKLCARTVSLFVDHRPNVALPLISEAYQKLNSITAHVEADWFPTSLSGATGQSLLCESLVGLITVQRSSILSTRRQGSCNRHMGDFENTPFQRDYDHRSRSVCFGLHPLHFRCSTIDFDARSNCSASAFTPVICYRAVWWFRSRCF